MITVDKNGYINLYKLHESQKQFIKSKFLHSGIVGGYQSGKSTAAAIKAILHLVQYPGVPIAYYLPIFRLFDDMLIPKLGELFESLGIQYKHNQQKSKIVSEYGEIWMRSMDSPDTIISYSVGYSIVDEVDLVHVNKRSAAMKRIASRNSYKKDTANSIDFVSTPEGFAYMYDFFIKKSNKHKKLFKLKTGDNEANLSSGYIQGLREQYTDEQLRAYLNGEFVNLNSGTVYNHFDRFNNNTDVTISENDNIIIGMDFNIMHMAAVVFVYKSGVMYAVNEFVDMYDTFAMIEAIKSHYPDRQIRVYPDASGANKNTSGTSDINLLTQAGFKVIVPSKNPFVKDRVNTMNMSFQDNFGRIRQYVNTNRCPVYTQCLEQQTYKNGEPDKTSGFDHILDAAGYAVHSILSLKPERRGQRA